jgi:hypothetical protein
VTILFRPRTFNHESDESSRIELVKGNAGQLDGRGGNKCRRAIELLRNVASTIWVFQLTESAKQLTHHDAMSYHSIHERFPMNKRTILGTLLLAFIMLCGMGLVQMGAGGSAGGTLPSGRTIMAHSDSIYLSTAMGGDTGTIKTSGKTIVVRPTTIEIDGNRVAAIDQTARKIEIHVKRGNINFLADGQPVNTSLR